MRAKSWTMQRCYIHWDYRWILYLTSIMDLYSCGMIAWILSKTLEVSCVIDTVNKAKARWKINTMLIIHSDRCSQYVSKEYRKATEKM